ncbi:hypothetical protein LIBAT_07840 [Leptospira interrogans]|uniref:hypothetical protein n=2 Tax=Leptospira interrogans TaxID=173 RepID=UPI0002B96932|nr:hypothetical protein [Leptospira interrogans]
MENENMPSLENSNDGRRARGKRLPLQIRNRIKPIEGKTSLRAIAKAYSVNQGDLSRTAYGDRKTPHLIQILEMEFNLPIEEIRAIFQKARETRNAFQKQQAENGIKISQSEETKAILKNMGFRG